ncbi:MAG: FHA domain-containing protein [Chloroflexi bacterium]|nr:FHA domain-containing protein [Chloroflexota bacterium]
MAGRLRLQIRDAGGQRELSFDSGQIVAGRESPSGLSLLDPLVSRLHGRFESRPDGWYFIDTNSRNGSSYNGSRLPPEQPVMLRQGDVLQLGGAYATVIELGPTPATGAVGDRPVSQAPRTGVGPSSVAPGTSPGGFQPDPARPSGYQYQPPRPNLPPVTAPMHGAVPPVAPNAPPSQQYQAPAAGVPQTGSPPQQYQAPQPPRPPSERRAADASRPSYVGLQDNIAHVGRAIDNDIVLSNGYVSSYHLEAWPQDNGLAVKDLGSRNGTSVGGRRLEPHQVVVVGRDAVLQLGPEITLSAQQIFEKLRAAPQESIYERRREDLAHLVVGQGLGRIVGKEQKVILRDVDVAVRRGQFIGIVGGSGAGKSTMMKVLNKYTPPETGTLLFSHGQAGEDEIGYVPQEDIIHRELPLKDALVLSAMLRYPPGTQRKLVEQRALEVLTELGLSEHTKTLVSRLSGGQRKRASVALELMRRPPLLILDEPTSGLDPASGRRLIKLLRALADTGVGILLVTHAMENLEGVDTLAFLAPGGNLVFWGSPKEAQEHFGTKDLAEVFDLLDPDGQPADVKRRAVLEWRSRFEQSRHYRALREEVDSGMRQLAPVAQYAAPPAPPPQGEAQWQLSGLAKRYYRILLGDRRNLLLLLGQVPVIILLAFVLFHRDALVNASRQSVKFPFPTRPAVCQQLSPGDQRRPPECDTNNNFKAGINLLFIASATMVWLGTINAAREICKELPIWERESHIGIKPVPYVLSKVLVLGGLCAIQTGIMVLMLLLLFEVPGGSGALTGLFMTGLLAAVSGVALGLLISASVPSADRATAIVPVAMIPQILLGGGILTLKEMGSAQWLTIVVSARWAFQGFGAFTSRTDYLTRCKVGDNGAPLLKPGTQECASLTDIYAMFDISPIIPVFMLIVLCAAFAAVAVWLVGRQVPKAAPVARPGYPVQMPAGPPVMR